MAVGTGNISLEEVRVELGLGSTSDLVACFAAAVDGDFTIVYKGNKDRLSNFKGYEVSSTVTLTSFSSSAGSNTQSSVCQYATVNQTYYHDGSNATPVVGDNVYSDSAGTTGLARDYYKLNALGTYHIKTGGTEVDSLDACL